MRRGILATLPLVGLLGCAPLFRTDIIATDRAAFAQPTAPGALVVTVPIAEADDSDHVFRYAVHLPSALELDWTLSCPDREENGTLGETFDAYRQRRLAELEQQRRQQASLVGALVGAAVPSVQAGAQVSAPGAQATAQGTIDPGQAAAAAAYASTPAPQLPPGDVGARTVDDSVDLGPVAAGACTFTLRNSHPEQDVSGVVVDVALDRLVDVAAEQQAQSAAAQAAARQTALAARTSVVADLRGAGATLRTAQDRQQADLALRITVTGLLVGAGADPGLRAREEAAAAAERARLAQEQEERRQAQLAAETARLQAELAAQAQAQQATAALRLREEEALRVGLALRLDIQGWLIRLGADPSYRLRLQTEDQRRRDEQRREEERTTEESRERDAATLRVGLALRGDVLRWLVGFGADPDYRWRLVERDAQAVPAALQLRDGVVRGLLALGADPGFRQRQFAEQWRLDQEQAALAQAQFDAAVALRNGLALQLVGLGAVARPPKPAAPVEVPPPPPFAGAVWVDGGYVWRGGTWVWIAGQYATASAAGALQLGGWTIDLGTATGGSATIEVGPGSR